MFLTNTPWPLYLDDPAPRSAFLAEGFQIPDFKEGVWFPSLRQIINAREAHIEMHNLMESIRDHSEIPSTFDGEIPEFAFDQNSPARLLLIGSRYLVKDADGVERPAELTTATVAEDERKAYCGMSFDNGKSGIWTVPLSDAEMAAWKRYPDTFFGDERQVVSGAMDRSEQVIYAHLQHRGVADIRCEPDGNVPPDFVVNQRVAVEARRLNQREDLPDAFRGLEETAIPFGRTMRQVLDAFGPPRAGISWFVSYTFRRPLAARPAMVRALTEALEQFASEPEPTRRRVSVASTVTLRFSVASKQHATMFVLGGSADHDGGGFVLAELVRDVSICIDEKSRKISPYRARYPEWWLMFADEIAYGSLDAGDIEEFRALMEIRKDHNWDKIVLVNPLDAARAIEL